MTETAPAECDRCRFHAEAAAHENFFEEHGRRPEADELAYATASALSMADDLGWHEAHA